MADRGKSKKARERAEEREKDRAELAEQEAIEIATEEAIARGLPRVTAELLAEAREMVRKKKLGQGEEG